MVSKNIARLTDATATAKSRVISEAGRAASQTLNLNLDPVDSGPTVLTLSLQCSSVLLVEKILQLGSYKAAQKGIAIDPIDPEPPKPKARFLFEDPVLHFAAIHRISPGTLRLTLKEPIP